MRCSVSALRCGLVSLVVLLPVVGLPLRAEEPTETRPLGEVKADSALVYLVREWNFQGGGRTWYVYSDDTFAGVLDNDCYTFTYLTPGRHLLWLSPRDSALVEVEAGQTYYFKVFGGIRPVDETTGKALVDGIESYCAPDDDQKEDAAEQIREDYAKTKLKAAGKPVVALPVATASQSGAQPTHTADSRRAQHVAQWPKVDLAPYGTLFVEDFVITDPKAAERSNESLVQSAPQRMPDMVVENLGAGVFDQVVRGTPPEPRPGAVILRTRVTQYKPGSKTARSMMAGLGSAQLEMTAELVDAQSGRSLVQIPVDRSWAWGGAVGASFGILDMERNVAYELALYLQRSRGVTPASPQSQQ